MPDTPPGTFLLLLFGDLGDALLAVPAIRALRCHFPQARLVLMGKSNPCGLIHELQLVDSVLAVDKHAYDRPGSLLRPNSLLNLFRLARQVRAEKADTVVLFHHLVTWWGTLKFAALALASGARRRVGLDNGRGFFLTDAVPDTGFGALHEAEYYLEVARRLGADGPLRLEVPISAEDRQRAALLLAPLRGHRLVAIHPGTGAYGPGRRWPAERFAEVAQDLLCDDCYRIVVVGAGVDREAGAVVEAVLGGRGVSLVDRTTVGELAAVLQQCSVLLANDGGVAHVGAAAGTPVVAVFGPSNDRAWRPVGSRVVAVSLPCRPCFYRDHQRGLPDGCATRECLMLIEPRHVLDEMRKAVDERAAPR